jgi:hypothetical protein
MKRVAILLTAFAATPAQLSADVLNVPGTYPTIQAAIDAAEAGDTVLIADGLYTGDGNRDMAVFGKPITIRSENGPASCTIDVEGFVDDKLHRAITVQNTDGLTIEGITFRGGRVDERGGALVVALSSATIISCVFTDNWTGVFIACDSFGGAISSQSSDLILSGVTFTNNIATTGCCAGSGAGYGGALYATGGSVMMRGCTFEDNRTYVCDHDVAQGGDVYVGGGTLFAEDSVFAGSRAMEGGSIFVLGSTAEMIRCTITASRAVQSDWIGGRGGGAASRSSTVSYRECHFVACRSEGPDGSGGAIYARGGQAFVDRCRFIGCFGEYGYNDVLGEWLGGVGGAIRTYQGAEAVISNSLFAGNRAESGELDGGEGGAIYAGGHFSITNCTFAGNEASLGASVYGQADTAIANSVFSDHATAPVEHGSMSFSLLGGGAPGEGNIDGEPTYVDPLGPDGLLYSGDEDFRLASGSLGIDAASNSLAAPGELDLAGAPRFVDDPDTADIGQGEPPLVDMGAYEFQPGLDLCESAHLLAPGAQAAESFGHSIAITGDTMFAGAFRDDTAGDNAGAAQVFTRANGHWLHTAELLADDAQPGDFFGFAASASGEAAIIGAPRADAAGTNGGAAYIFRRSNGVWTQEAKLVPDDAGAGDQFGCSASLVGDTVLVGAWMANLPGKSRAGVAYIFERDNGAWVQKAKLIASDASANEQFGWVVGLSPPFAHIGAPSDDNDNGIDAGTAYVYRQEGGQWLQRAKLIAPGGEAGDQFGSAIAADGLRVLVGAIESDTIAPDAGAAWLYRYDGQGWAVETGLLHSGAEAGDGAGQAVALSGQLALIGTWMRDEQGVDSGAAVLFTRDGQEWSQAATLTGKSIEAGDLAGTSVAIGPGVLAAGAIHADGPGGVDQGAVLVYSTVGCPCYADFTGDGALDLFDFLGYLNAFNGGEPAADCDGAGGLDLFDFLCFVNAFNEGC